MFQLYLLLYVSATASFPTFTNLVRFNRPGTLFKLINTYDENVYLSRVKYPSGLYFTEVSTSGNQSEQVQVCLLQRNSVLLRPLHRKVYELPNVLSSSECVEVINSAETYALNHGGWTTSRHRSYPTTDIPLEAAMGYFSKTHGILAGELLPQMAELFDLDEAKLKIEELFIAKYEYKEGKQNSLGPHKDGCPWSFVLALNDPLNEFIGGGTRFVEDYDETWFDINGTKSHSVFNEMDVVDAAPVLRNTTYLYRPNQAGTAVVFSGQHTHEGVPITSGCRYILTGFCSYGCREGSETDENYMRHYDPRYDGSARSNGIIAGDVLKGILISSNTKHDQKKNQFFNNFLPSDASVDRFHMENVQLSPNISESIRCEVLSTNIFNSTELCEIIQFCSENSESLYKELERVVLPTLERSLQDTFCETSQKSELNDSLHQIYLLFERVHIDNLLIPDDPVNEFSGSNQTKLKSIVNTALENSPRLISTGNFWKLDYFLKPYGK